MRVTVRQAQHAEHDKLLELFKTSKWTNAFGHMMFSDVKMYEKGWIRCAVTSAGNIVGAYCVRHKVRDPETSLYFITVHPIAKGVGVGHTLLVDLKERCPNKRIILNVGKVNKEAVDFYDREGFVIENDQALKGTAFKMSLEWE